ncbi:endo-1,4-beta-xylanase [Fibrobacter sp.]|uniref:endo-1,4-beta-xylanase n=1 Tax=Fibrobacter sp. TaxID=35828 RepID=UPI00388EAA4C
MEKSFSRAARAVAVATLAVSSLSLAAPFAEGGAKFIGNITTRGQVQSDFGTYWNQITAENECKWASIEASRGNFNFNGCDACYNWAKKNGGHFKFHALVWGSQYPNWLNGLSADETKKAITTWFDRVAKQYPDLEMIDVVNEAIKSGGSYHSGYGKNNNIIPALGGDNGNYEFVATAFKMARERWPKAILIYNDYNTFQWQINEGIDLVNKLVKQGAPVDAYGQQAHDLTDMNESNFKSALNKIQTSVKNAKGEPMPLFITEYDIGTDNDNQQKQRYSEQIPAFWESPQVAGITLWGYVYGATWTTNGNSGIIKNGSDRPAMKWMKEYFGNPSNVAKGKNTTGLIGGEGYEPPEPVPQEPFKGTALAIPGKIEVEDYDKNGVGEGNTSYSDDYTNDGGSKYRDGDGVDLYDEGTGVVLGMTKTGEWLEYTVEVAKDAEYTIVTSGAAGGTSAAIKYYIDDKAVTDEIKIDQTADNKWDVYKDFSAKTTKITAGKHVLKLEITGDYANVDYFTFVEGDVASTGGNGGNTAQTGDNGNTAQAGDNGGDSQIGGNDEEPPAAIGAGFKYDPNALQDYYVFDQQGVRLGVLSAYGFEAATEILQSSSAVKKSGVYYLRNRFTGAMQSVRVVR